MPDPGLATIVSTGAAVVSKGLGVRTLAGKLIDQTSTNSHVCNLRRGSLDWDFNQH